VRDLLHAVDELTARIADAPSMCRLDVGEGVFDVGRDLTVRQSLSQGGDDVVDRHVRMKADQVAHAASRGPADLRRRVADASHQQIQHRFPVLFRVRQVIDARDDGAGIAYICRGG
jgi:hypothetical protein